MNDKPDAEPKIALDRYYLCLLVCLYLSIQAFDGLRSGNKGMSSQLLDSTNVEGLQETLLS